MKKISEKIKHSVTSLRQNQTKPTVANSPSYKNVSQKTTIPLNRISSLDDHQDLQKRIEEKAYEIFERRGYSHGNDWSDWFEAERIVKSQN